MHNNICKVNLGHLSELENNLLFSLFNRLKDKQDTFVVFTPKEVKQLTGDPKISNTDLLRLARNLIDNLIKANFKQIIQGSDGDSGTSLQAFCKTDRLIRIRRPLISGFSSASSPPSLPLQGAKGKNKNDFALIMR
ncbi:RepB family plasmid replication initiator protein [Helicobacter sp. NHP22-001]|uniref:RepB family plasmid replication initiator protein n=1 Tax=Helicobacter sp. NHP22-001 TaxID=3040202 RepID=UPI003319AC45